MTKKALIILFASIGGAIVVGGTTTAIVVSNSTTYVDDPTADTTSFVYNGSEQTYKLQESDLYTITGNKKTDAGEYSVTVSLNKKKKYAWKSTKKSDDLIFNFTIDKKGVLEPSAGTSLFEYTGSEVTYTVTNEDSSFYTVTNNKATNAGTYNAKVSLNDAKNYKWKNSNKSDDLTLPFTISQKDVSSLIAIDDIEDMEYTGEHINPNVTLKTAIPEYEITYGENVNVGKGTVTITAKGNFTGSKTFEFNIVKKKITIPTPTTTEYTYTGSEIVHNIPESGYYDILNNKAINAGNYTATLSLKDKTNTTWSDGTTEDKEYNFTINPITILETNVQNIDNVTYTGQAITPEVVITINNITLVKDIDYTISYSNNTNAGPASVTITGKGNFTGTIIKTFTIAKKVPSVTAPTAKEGLRYTGSDQELIIAGSTTDGTLEYKVNDNDYSTSIPTGLERGEYTIYYRVMGNDNVENISESSFTVTIQNPYAQYTSKPETKVGLVYDGTEQELGIEGSSTQGTVLYSLTGNEDDFNENLPKATNAKKYTVFFKLRSNNPSLYDDAIEIEQFEVTIAKAKASFDEGKEPTKIDLEYNGLEQVLVTAGVTSIENVTILYSDNINDGYTEELPKATNAGHHTVCYYIKSNNENYTDSDKQSTTVYIAPKSITLATVQISEERTYTGSEIKPVTVMDGTTPLVEGTDYTIEYANNINAGNNTATYTITGKGNYGGTVDGTFTITPKPITSTMVQILDERTYTGDEIKPVKLTDGNKALIEGTDYTVEYTNNINVSDTPATYTITGKGNYGESVEGSFTIAKATISVAEPTAKEGLVDDGSTEHELIIASETDLTGIGYFEYKLGENGTWSNDIPTAKLEGIYYIYYRVISNNNNYKSRDFENPIVVIIAKENTKSITDATITMSAESFTYNGQNQTPVITIEYNDITLDENVHYTLSYNSDTRNDVGTYTITITGDGYFYKDYIEKTYTINQAPITITLTAQNDSWTGNEPTVSQTAYTTGDGQLVSGDSLGITITKATGTDVGEYDLTAKITNTNYNPTFVNSKFTITAVDPTSTTNPAGIENLVFNGSAQTLITAGVADGGTYMYKLDDGQFSESLPQTTNADDYTITYYIKGDKNHNDSAKVSIDVTITKKAIETPAEDETVYTYTGSVLTYVVAASSDYTITGNKQTNAGSYTVTITLNDKNNTIWNNNTNNDITYQFIIKKAEASYNAPTARNITYTGEDQPLVNAATTSHGTPMYSLTENGTYGENIPAGTNANTYTVWYYIAGDKNHNDSTPLTVQATIKKAEVAKPKAPTTTSYTYTGTTITHNLTTSDYYTITDNTAINVGNYTAKVNLNDSNNYCWKETSYTPTSIDELGYEFEITAKALTANMVTLSDNSFVYNGDNQKPTVTVTDSTYLVAADYTITNDGGVNVGTYDVKVVAQGNYTGSITKQFTITPKTLTEDMVTLSTDSFVYTGINQKPSVTVADSTYLVAADYTITNDGGVNVGTYHVIVNGKGNYTGSVDLTFNINSQNIEIDDTEMVDVQLDYTSFTYNGKNQTPEITITGKIDGSNTFNYDLVLNQDYTISYNKSKQINTGTYTITITAIGNYFIGSTTKQYTIDAKTLTNYTLTFNPLTYNGSEQYPASTGSFTLIDNDLDSSVSNISSQYRVTSSAKNTNAGTGYSVTINVAPSSQYTSGAIVGTYEIQPCNVNNCTYKINNNVEFDENIKVPFTSNVEENGYNPELVVKLGTLVDLAKTTDYTLSYGTNNSLGTGTVTITGTGNFTGEKTIEFSIVNTPITLTFKYNYDNCPADQDIIFTSPYDDSLPIFERDYYDFKGWRTTITPYKTFDVDATLDMLVGYNAFNAQWDWHEYTITYENVVGTNPNPSTYTYNSAEITLQDLSGAFLGWYTDSECTEGNEITAIPHNSYGDKKIYAKWDDTAYTITYHTNSEYSIDNGSYTKYSSTIDLPIPSKDYYDFEGWYENSSLTGTKVTQITQGSTGNKDFWANWTPTTYYIIYNNSSSDPEPANPTKYTYETPTFTLINPTKGGNIFVGWFTQGGTQVAQITQGSHGNLDLTARYTGIPTSFEIQITHDLSDSSTSAAGTITNNTFGDKYVGDTITPKFTVNPTYTFLGWYNGSTLVSSEPSFEVTLTSTPTTYTAKVARYMIAVTGDGGTVSPSGVTYLKTGDSIELTATTNNTNYIFCGWFKDGSDTAESLSFNINVTMESDDIAYQAKWTHFTIEKQNSDNSNNNKINDDADHDIYNYGNSYIVGNTIELIATTGAKYAFLGWYYVDSNNVEHKITHESTYIYTFNDTDKKLIAKFVENKITVTQGLLFTDLTDEDIPQPFFVMSTGGSYGTAGTDNIMDSDEKITYTATNNNNMFAGWYEVGSSGIKVGNPNTQTTYSLISRATSIKLAPGTERAIYAIYIAKLDANATPSSLVPSTTGSNYSGDPLIITPQTSNAYKFTKYTINGVDVESDDTRLDGNVLTYTEDLDTTLASADNLRNRVSIVVVYDRTSALVQAGKYSGSSFIESSNAGTVTKNENTYTPSPAIGYEFVGWMWQKADKSNNIQNVDSSKLDGTNLVLESEDYDDYFAIFAPLTNIHYTVNYYLQNAENDEYTLDHSVDGNDGTTDETKEVTPDTITGATFNSTESTIEQTIAGNGTTVFNLYFDRNMITVNYQYNNGTSTSLTPVSQKYGSLPKANTKEGWTKEIAGWYTDCDFTNAFTGTITSTVTLFARWQDDVILTETNVTNYTAYVAVKISDSVAADAITNDENIIIPSYYNGIPVTIVDVNNLIVNKKIYAKATMPDNLEEVIYGKYNSIDIYWLVLDTTNGYKLLSKNTLGPASQGNLATSALSDLENATGIIGMDLLTLSDFNQSKNNPSIILSEAWWLKDLNPSNANLKYYVPNGKNTPLPSGVANVPSIKYGIRPTITI